MMVRLVTYRAFSTALKIGNSKLIYYLRHERTALLTKYDPKKNPTQSILKSNS